MEFGELTEDEFGGVRFASDNFLQSVEMFRRYREMGRQAYLVGVKDVQGRIVAKGLILAKKWRLGKQIMRVPGGWLMDYDGENWVEILRFLTEKVREFVKKKGGMVLEIAPNIVSQPRDADGEVAPGENNLEVKRELESLGYKYLGEYEQAKWVFVKELGGETPEEMLMSFRTDCRQRIRRAERDGVQVRELSEDELGKLKQVVSATGERQGFLDPDLEYYKSMRKAFGDKVKFVVAEMPVEKMREEDREGCEEQKMATLAAAMFVKDDEEMIYLYSGSVRKLQRYGGAHLIQWKMLQEALDLGCKRYNFYGTKPIEGNGVYQFKKGFRGHVEELLGTFALPVGLVGRFYIMRLKTQEFNEIQ